MVAVPSIGRATQVIPRRAAREADATRDLYEQYARQIYTYCLQQLGNREEAEDATQSTFLNAFRGLQRGVDPEFESAWLYKIAQNVCLTRQRSSSRRRRVESPGDLDAMQDFVPAHQADSDELIRLPEALDTMPEQQRRALLLREWQGLSYKEIGEELDLSQAAVETLLFRARRSLAAALTEEKPKKGIAQRLRASGDAGSLLAIVKSLLITGGAKVAATVATVAATTVVAASPSARQAVEQVMALSPAPQAAKPAVVVSQPAAAAPVAVPSALIPAAPPAAGPAQADHRALAPARRDSTAPSAAGGSSLAGGHAPILFGDQVVPTTPDPAQVPVPVDVPAAAAAPQPAPTVAAPAAPPAAAPVAHTEPAAPSQPPAPPAARGKTTDSAKGESAPTTDAATPAASPFAPPATVAPGQAKTGFGRDAGWGRGKDNGNNKNNGNRKDNGNGKSGGGAAGTDATTVPSAPVDPGAAPAAAPSVVGPSSVQAAAPSVTVPVVPAPPAPWGGDRNGKDGGNGGGKKSPPPVGASSFAPPSSTPAPTFLSQAPPPSAPVSTPASAPANTPASTSASTPFTQPMPSAPILPFGPSTHTSSGGGNGDHGSWQGHKR
jgi:RNA polymerase sigma factor (sigma-70 family)